ncbi:MAG: CBS domain-containing protein, partial [Deltaproteobacteria bacterium]|nr:CBS domain-containing protein [Deltaproteobacteria bacterium]
ELATPPKTISLDEDLYSALLKFLESGYGQIPVIDNQQDGKIVGMLQHQDVIYAYHKEIERRKGMG